MIGDADVALQEPDAVERAGQEEPQQARDEPEDLGHSDRVLLQSPPEAFEQRAEGHEHDSGADADADADRRVPVPRPPIVAAESVPTVEEAAEAASISRTTAYRYFPNKRALLLAAHPEMSATSMLPPHPPTDPAARLDAVVRNFTSMILETELQQRTNAPPVTRDG